MLRNISLLQTEAKSQKSLDLEESRIQSLMNWELVIKMENRRERVMECLENVAKDKQLLKVAQLVKNSRQVFAEVKSYQ